MENLIERPIKHMGIQFFAEPALDPQGPAVDSTPAADPVADPAPDPSQDPAPDISDLQQQLAALKKSKDAAERALTLEKQAHTKLKREHMTDADLLADQKREMEEKARMYDRQMSAITAEKILVSAGLNGDDYEGLLGLIVSEDAEKTEMTAQMIVDILALQTKLAVRAEREKILQETPSLPAGSGSAEVTLNEQLRGMLYGMKG